MNRRELLRLAPCVLGLTAFRPRASGGAKPLLIEVTTRHDRDHIRRFVVETNSESIAAQLGPPLNTVTGGRKLSARSARALRPGLCEVEWHYLPAVRRSKPGIDSLEGLGLHPDDIERI